MLTNHTACRNILVVDDDPDLREVLRNVLEDEWHRVEVARNGHEALQVLRQADSTQLILLDLMMPTMDGLAFRRAQLADAALADIPVVLLSAMHELPQRIQATSVDATLAKPFSVHALLEAVQRYARI